jgi:hypothetical protein
MKVGTLVTVTDRIISRQGMIAVITEIVDPVWALPRLYWVKILSTGEEYRLTIDCLEPVATD